MTCPCSSGKPPSKRITIGGQEVGIAGFEEMMAKGLENLKATDEEQRGILLEELKARNYVPHELEKQYLDAIWVEFKKLRAKTLGQIEERYHGIPREEIRWYPTIDYEKCSGCGVCFKFCQRGVYTFDEKPHVSNPYRCVVSCTGCKTQCNEDAISFPTLVELRESMKCLRKKYGIISE